MCLGGIGQYECVAYNTVTPEVSAFLTVLTQQKEEQRLFQFLNGLDEQFGNLRSQMLMMVPLPSVESACSMLQQEESQRVLFGSNTFESIALYSKGVVKDKCSICGYKWQSSREVLGKSGVSSLASKGKTQSGKDSV